MEYHEARECCDLFAVYLMSLKTDSGKDYDRAFFQERGVKILVLYLLITVGSA